MKKIGAVILIILIAAGIGYFYFEDPDPREEVLSGFENTSQAVREGSVTSESNLDFAIEGLEGGMGTPEEVNVAGQKQADLNLPEAFEMDFEGEFSEGEGAMAMSAEAGLLFAENSLYGRVDTVPMGMIPDEIIGEYILLEEDVDLEAGLEEMEDELRAVDPELEEELEEAEVDPEIVEEMIEDFFHGLFEEEVVEIVETIDGEFRDRSARRHELSLSLERLPDLIEQLVEDYEEDIPQLQDEEVEEGLEEMREELEEFDPEEEAEDMEIGVYVWTDGEYLIGFEVNMEIEDLEEVDYFEMDYTQGFENFGEDFNITPPEEYLTEEEVMELMMPTPGIMQEEEEDQIEIESEPQLESEPEIEF